MNLLVNKFLRWIGKKSVLLFGHTRGNISGMNIVVMSKNYIPIRYLKKLEKESDEEI